MSLIVHIDMNSYFASVEQQANAHLRGRPVGVCAYLHPHGCVIAASVEAKRLGMRVGMTMVEAKQIIPDAFFVQCDPTKYRAVTSRIFQILNDVSDTIEHYSIDEAFLDLTGWCRDAAEAAFLFLQVKKRIREEVGEWLRCSVGIAPTRFLAKFASDRQKPDGLVVITPENLDHYLVNADLEDACGISKRIRRRLERIGIHTLLELKTFPIGNLFRAFGVYGYQLWCHLNGIECERLQTNDGASAPAPKSMGHSYCVPHKVNREGRVEAVLAKLTDRAGQRLREYDLSAGEATLIVGWRDGGTSSVMRHRFGEPVNDVFTLSATASRLLASVWDGADVNFLAITFSDLCPPTHQLCLDKKENRLRPLTRSVDVIRDRYGSTSIFLGRMMPAIYTDDAPDRIGFRKTDGVTMTIV